MGHRHRPYIRSERFRILVSAESYQFCEGATEMGVGTADADARSTRANLEADTSRMYCESQRRRESIGVCMLSPLHQNAYRRIEGY